MLQQQTEIEALFDAAGRLAADALQSNQDRTHPVVHRVSPEELIRCLELELPTEGRGLESVLDLARKTLHYSVRTGHPRFMNQLFGGFDAAAILGEWICALTNTSMYTFEAAPVGTVVELALIERLNRFVGFENGEGVFAPGGSVSNLISVLAARHRAFPHVKDEGLRPSDRPVMFTSAEAHYSLQRAGMIAGLGRNGTVCVPVDEVGRMIPGELERCILEERRKGRTPFFVAATAGTTVPGAFDPIDEIANVAERHGLWMHIDGSYGGSVLLSRQHRHLMRGCERADSIAWNPHKMMGVPLSSSATLMRTKGSLVSTMGMNADYLFHEESDANWDLGDRTLQCGRRVDALKLWFSWQVLGDRGFEARVDGLFDQASRMRELVREREGFRLIREQEGANVCFRYLPRAHRSAAGEERDRHEHEATLRIRGKLAEEGSFLVNYASLDGAATFRLVASNPDTTEEDQTALLDAIEAED
ncbi:MAG TPA: glutamate decarboxylase [Planctomycetes bacterium]|nr:glutamate decarboxylase [Planctomycetota bacterium]